MRGTLVVGLTHEESMVVDDTVVVPALPGRVADFSHMPSVLATAMVVAFVEATAVALLAQHMDDGEVSLGTHVDLSHEGATPPGGTVTARVTVASVDGATVWFDARVTDDAGVVSSGRHRRAVVATERFLAGVARHPAAG